ncbi:MAG: O-antigen ligase family protein [Naasia sp.]
MDEPRRVSPATAPVVETSARTICLAAAFLLLGFGGQAVRNLLGWPGFVLVSLALLSLAVRVLLDARPSIRIVPPALLAFLLVCAGSLLWSDYRWTTALAVAAQLATTAAGVAIAVTLDRRTVILVLARSSSLLVAVSLVFEILVTTVVGHRFAPFTGERSPDLPGAFYWSENRLLEGGPIQGVVGNRNLLAFIALLAIISVIVVAVNRRRASRLDVASLSTAVAALALTRSATVIAALIVVAALAAAVLVLRRVPSEHRSRALIATGAAGVGVTLLAWQHTDLVLGLLGRSDLTNRVDVWRTVASIAEQSPWLGLGWTGYWAPWAKPFDGLIVIDGVEYLQAHNALLDVWLQVGAVGVVAACWLVGTVLMKAIRLAMLSERRDLGLSIAPLLLVVALLVQSLTESRLLIEGNWMLLVVLALHLAASERTRPSLAPEPAQRGSVRAGSASDRRPR